MQDSFHTLDLLEEISSSQMKIGVSLPTPPTRVRKIGVISEKLQPLLSYLEIFFLHSTTFKLVVSIIQIYILCWGVFSHQTDTWIYRYCNLRLSEDSSLERTFDYESSGITGIAPTRGINIFGYNFFSQSPQSTVFGLEGELTLSGSLTSPSFHSLNLKELGNFRFLTGSPKLFVDSITRSSCTNYLVMSILVELLIGFSPALLVLVLQHSVQVRRIPDISQNH